MPVPNGVESLKYPKYSTNNVIHGPQP